jgi:hypothetical protein
MNIEYSNSSTVDSQHISLTIVPAIYPKILNTKIDMAEESGRRRWGTEARTRPVAPGTIAPPKNSTAHTRVSTAVKEVAMLANIADMVAKHANKAQNLVVRFAPWVP